MRRIYYVLLAAVMIMSINTTSYAFYEVARGSVLGVNAESVIVLNSKEDLQSVLAALRIPKLEVTDSFDFTKEFLVLIVASACPNPGYSVVAETVEFKDGKANVKYKTMRGPDGMMYAQVIAYPWLIVALER